MSRFGYNIRQSFSQMNRNKGMYFTSTMAITAMMLILGLFFVTFVNVSLFTANIEKDYNVIQVYMKEGNKQEVTQEAGAALEAMDGVDHITYVSKDEALSTLKTRWGDNGYLLENLPENPLPDSYNVYVKDKNAANAVAEAAPEVKGVDDVVYYRDTIEKLSQVSKFVEMGSLITMAFLVVVSIVIVANTIKLTVFNREKEIGIMKYLGATDWFVRAPFIWGGIIMLLVAFALPAIAASSGNAEILLGSIADVHYIGTLVITTILYIIGGFLFYASMYAAIGSAVDTPQDAAQFNSVIMLPIIIAIYVLMAVIKNPGSDVAFWFSMIPFTSPMVMMARIPAGIPTWEIVVSLAVLYVSFIILIWLASRIFRIGVFMHGKKPTWKDLGQWIKMK